VVSATAPAAPDESFAASPTTSLSAGQAILLQVLPGLPAIGLYLLLARWLGEPILALYLSILFAEVPATWAIMIVIARRESGRAAIPALFPWRSRPTFGPLVAKGLGLALLSLLLMGSLTVAIAEPLRLALFGWVPEWAVMNPAAGLDDMSVRSQVAVVVLGFTSATVVGGMTQELFARGFLLPRTAHLGALAPVLNAGAFAMLHLASPWSWPVFFLISLPWAVAVYRTQSMAYGLVGHMGMLFLMWLGTVSAILLGRLPGPG